MRAAISRAALAAALAAAAPAAAQVATAIVPDGAPGRSTGTFTVERGNLTFIDGGTRVGDNLFHSFDSFSLGTGSVAIWYRSAGDGASIRNIVNRVTGGSASQIDGTLATQFMPNADFWFVNPAGIVFGPNASLAIPNSVHFATAGQLRFADGAAFSTVTPEGSTFTSAPVAAFGFLGGQGDIALLGSSLSAERLTLAAANVVSSRSTLIAGGIDIVAAGAAPLLLAADDPRGAPASGKVTLIDSQLVTGPTPATDGAIRLVGGQVRLAGSLVESLAGTDAVGGDIQVGSASLQLIDGSAIVARTVTAMAGGSIGISADDLEIGDSKVSVETGGTGATGSLTLAVGALRISGSSDRSLGVVGAQAEPGSTGTVGPIAIDAGAVGLGEWGSIQSLSFGPRDAGAIAIRADSLDSHGGLISSQSFGPGNSGAVSVDAATLTLDAGGIQSLIHGSGNAGKVEVAADRMVLTARGFIQSGTAAGSSGNAGDVSVAARTITLSGEARIKALSAGAGDAGDVSISASDRIDLDGAAFISSQATSTEATADGGRIAISAPILALDHGGFIAASAWGGKGGDIAVDVGSLSLDHGADIEATAAGTGDAGTISILADRLALANGSAIDSSTDGPGQGGRIAIEADEVAIASSSAVSAFALGSGNGGSVAIHAGTLLLQSDGPATAQQPASVIQTSSLGPGAAGSISLDAGRVEIHGGLVIAAADGSGKGGDIAIAAGELLLDHQALIESGSAPSASGSGGDVRIVAGTVEMAGSAVDATTSGSGDGGRVDLQADRLAMTDMSAILSATWGTGNAGGVVVAADTIRLDRSVISSSASGTSAPSQGAAGSVELAATTLELGGGSLVSTSSDNGHSAGDIVVTSGLVRLAGGSRIDSRNVAPVPGSAGSIAIAASRIELFEGSSLSTDSAFGAAGDISLNLPRDGTLVLSGASAGSVITTTSGPGTGGRITISDPYLILSDGGAILALGEQGGANVRLQADYFIRSADRLNLVAVAGNLIVDSQIGDLSTGARPDDLSYLDASSVLRGQCPAGGAAGGVSRFTARITGPYAPLAPPPAVLAPGAEAAVRPARLALLGGCGR